MNVSHRRILVVDDDVDICANMHDILTDLGYEVSIACSGNDALDRLNASPFDLALLDLRMGDMDGLTLYREMQSIVPGIPSMLISAYVSADVADEATRAGMVQVLSKPVDLSSLIPLIDATLN